MSTIRYTPEFKDEAVRHVLDRGYPVRGSGAIRRVSP